jgi:arylsulfatase A-like enzyme
MLKLKLEAYRLVVLPATFVFLLLLVSSCRGVLTPKPTGVVLITIDTLRADYLGVYGSEVATPHLDELAAEGTTFLDAVVQSPLTLPSHSSILTGTYPTYHGVRDNGRFRLADEI